MPGHTKWLPLEVRNESREHESWDDSVFEGDRLGGANPVGFVDDRLPGRPDFGRSFL